MPVDYTTVLDVTRNKVLSVLKNMKRGKTPTRGWHIGMF